MIVCDHEIYDYEGSSVISKEPQEHCMNGSLMNFYDPQFYLFLTSSVLNYNKLHSYSH